MYRLIITLSLLLSSIGAMARSPIYVVNGEQREGIDDIPHEQILSLREQEVSEALIQQWGAAASKGVVFVELKWDKVAQLPNYDSLHQYLEQRVDWRDDIARISFRYIVTEQGEFKLTEYLEVSSPRARRRVEEALKDLPLWQPATKGDRRVEWSGVVNITLPVGAQIPQDRYLIRR